MLDGSVYQDGQMNINSRGSCEEIQGGWNIETQANDRGRGEREGHAFTTQNDIKMEGHPKRANRWSTDEIRWRGDTDMPKKTLK